MKLQRRQFLHLGAGAAALPAVARIAWGQTYPIRPITIVVPFAPGGTTDVVARIVGEHLSRRLGQQFVIENVAGAGGTTGTIRTMRASSDGYTIQIGQMGPMRPRWRSIRTSPTNRMSTLSQSAWSPVCLS